MKKIGKIGVFLCMFLFLSAITVFALSEASVSYYFFSDKVDVHMKEYTLRNGKYVPWEQGALVLPGGYLSKIPVIYNEGVECYVRTQVNISSEWEASVPLTLEDIDGISEKWIRCGEYFYYKDVLPEDGEVTFFEGIHIPKEWTSEVDSGNQWSVDVKVEAVQAKNLTPDFSDEDPWNMQRDNYTILGAYEEEPLEDEEMQGSFIFTIESQLEGFEVGIEQNFQNLGGFVPGDIKERSIYIYNRDKDARTIYLNADFEEETLLMEVMELQILWECDSEEQYLYRGMLCDVKESLRKMELSVPGNSEGRMLIALSLPKAVNNVFAAKEGNVKFTLTNELPQYDIPDDSVVQTGDENVLWIWFISAGVGLIVMAGCLGYLSWRKGLFYDE